MHAYGIKRDYNAHDDYLKNSEPRSSRKQAKLKKLMHRHGRRTAKHALRKEISQ